MLSVARDPLHCLSVSLSLLITFAVVRRPRRACWHFYLLHSTFNTYCMCLVWSFLATDRPTCGLPTTTKLRFTPSLKRHLPHILTLEPCLVLPYLVWAPSSPRASSPTACARKKQRRKIIQRQHRVVAQRGSHHTGSPTTAQNESPRAHDI